MTLRTALGYALDFGRVVQFAATVETDLTSRAMNARAHTNEADNPATEGVLEMYAYELAHAYPRLARYSVLLLAYGILDAALANLCDQIRDRLRCPIGVRDLSGDGLQRYCLYVQRLTGVDLSAHTSWQIVRDAATVRHCLAHAFGDVTRMHKPGRVRRAARALGFETTGHLLEIPPDIALRIVSDLSSWLDEVVGDIEAALPQPES